MEVPLLPFPNEERRTLKGFEDIYPKFKASAAFARGFRIQGSVLVVGVENHLNDSVADDMRRRRGVQGYLAKKNPPPPPPDHQRTLGIVLL
jgi:hypothetical protein